MGARMLNLMRSSLRRWASLACVLIILGLRPAPGLSAPAVPAFDHVFVIVMENHSYAEIIGNTREAPYINQLAGQYGLAGNYFAVSHPSLPNYLSLVGGDTFGITTDCTTCFLTGPNLAADRVVT